ncbi:type II secretion system protein GspE [Candidatus Desantisbacteria bacterium CG_4_10_14_3_um_filter_40_18]|uniref:Type II secretion system protein GspE n=1 Tax=Candidatus Desantisbacteria bacterium CG_4_10_14_3_um_filter_40_18 TaxID=1974544 RepID=A0A2M7P482_9BACT|nr:MAG: type II secretion system protein GspE [Candidatus Desantisbacteria bacterium CG_4_10_14_3_um_filter_40_18]
MAVISAMPVEVNGAKEDKNPSPKGKRRLGEMLVEKGIINYSQLKQALDIQKKGGDRLACVLVELGIVNEIAIADFLSSETKTPRVTKEQLRAVDLSVKGLISENIIHKNLVIPLSKKDKTLTVALTDPLNIFLIDSLSARTKCIIQPVIATASEIKEVIERTYGKTLSVASIIKKMEVQKGVEIIQPDIEKEDITLLVKESGEASVVSLVNYILMDAIRNRASDIHIEPFENQVRIRTRIDGILYESPSPPKKYQNAIVSRIKIMSGLDIAEKRLPQDGRFKVKYEGRNIDFRVSMIPTAFGEKVVLRVLDASALCLDIVDLGLEAKTFDLFKKCIHAPYGIILVTGPTGSGKTTTLYSTLKSMDSVAKNIITIEDPIEYVLPGVNQLQIKPEIGLDFTDGLRSFLRQDPDIIMVGEIRDRETAEVSINAALTGHLVFTTLHTNDSAGAITRLINMGIEPFLISSTVIMSIAQRLVRKICPDCKEEYKESAKNLQAVGVKIDSSREVTLYRGIGCDRCKGIGYKGRLAIFEVMVLTEEIRQHILSREPSQIIKQSAMNSGMISLREAALRKVAAGLTTVEEVLRLTFEEKMGDM